jgi:hypothetical protein
MENNFKLNGFSVEGNFQKILTDKLYNGKKCYEVVDGIVTGISLVSKPAHGKNFKIIDEENRLIAGVVLSPNVMIKRFDRVLKEEYYIYFTAESIKKIKSNSGEL